MSGITLAVVPSSTPGDSRFALDAVCVALTKLLDTPVHGINCASYAQLASELEKNRVDFAWMSPALMVLTNERIQLRPLLSAVRNDRTDYCSALFVDAAGPLATLDALRGRTAAWVAPTSAAGYLFPRFQLAARGLDPLHLFGRELFLHSHGEVVRAVLDGRADVGATYAERPPHGQPILRAGFLDVAPDRPVRVLEWSSPIPNDVIVGHGLLPSPTHREFAGAILSLSERAEGRRLLFRAFHTERFVATPRNALRSLHELVRDARDRGLLPQL
jgi:phosphonate transport system substrate-binding protein